VRRLIFKLHLYASLIFGAFITILGMTGGIMAFETELADLARARLVYVTPGPRPLSLAEIGAVATNHFTGESIQGFGLATAPNHSYRVRLRHRTVFVNQYTGGILGEQAGPDGVDKFLNGVHQFHLRLLLRNSADVGRQIVSWSGVAMVWLLVSGLYLWWPAKRARIRWSRRTAGSTRPFWFDLHNAVGIYSVVFLFALAVTGVLIGLERQTVPLYFRLTGTTPTPPARPLAAHAPAATPISPDEAISIARAALPGVAPFDINVPKPGERYQIRARYPEDLTPGGRSLISLDPYTGQTLFVEGSRTAPAGKRLNTLNRAVHTGDVFGLPSKCAMSLASLMAPVMFISGLMMWWKNRGRKVAL